MQLLLNNINVIIFIDRIVKNIFYNKNISIIN